MIKAEVREPRHWKGASPGGATFNLDGRKVLETAERHHVGQPKAREIGEKMVEADSGQGTDDGVLVADGSLGAAGGEDGSGLK